MFALDCVNSDGVLQGYIEMLNNVTSTYIHQEWCFPWWLLVVLILLFVCCCCCILCCCLRRRASKPAAVRELQKQSSSKIRRSVRFGAEEVVGIAADGLAEEAPGAPPILAEIDLPIGWEIVFTGEGDDAQPYFFNTATGESQWEKPSPPKLSWQSRSGSVEEIGMARRVLSTTDARA